MRKCAGIGIDIVGTGAGPSRLIVVVVGLSIPVLITHFKNGFGDKPDEGINGSSGSGRDLRIKKK